MSNPDEVLFELSSRTKPTFKRVCSADRKSYTLHDIKAAFELYDRLKQDGVKNLQTTLAKERGVPQGTFAGWFKNREMLEEKIAGATEAEMNHFQGM